MHTARSIGSRARADESLAGAPIAVITNANLSVTRGLVWLEDVHYVGNKFNHRVPDDMVLLRCFVVGNGLALTDDELVANARSELRGIMGLQAQPVFHSIARWPNAMAQYTVGHAQRVERIDAIVQTIPGLHLAGNAYRGIGIPDCVKMGKDAATRISSLA